MTLNVCQLYAAITARGATMHLSGDWLVIQNPFCMTDAQFKQLRAMEGQMKTLLGMTPISNAKAKEAAHK